MANKDYNERFETERWRPQDDIPYEQIVKHIIEDYYRIQERLEKLVDYTKKLERDYENEKKQRISKGEKNKIIGERFTVINRKYKRLYTFLEYLKEKYNITEDIKEFSTPDDNE